MRATCYLICYRGGISRMTKRLPSLSGGEVAVKLRIDINDKHFRNALVEADLTVDERYLMRPDAQLTLVDPPEPRTEQA